MFEKIVGVGIYALVLTFVAAVFGWTLFWVVTNTTYWVFGADVAWNVSALVLGCVRAEIITPFAFAVLCWFGYRHDPISFNRTIR